VKLQIQVRICGQILLSATVKELLKSESIGESYAQIKNGPVFLTHSVEIKTPQVSRMQSTLLLSLFSTHARRSRRSKYTPYTHRRDAVRKLYQVHGRKFNQLSLLAKRKH